MRSYRLGAAIGLLALSLWAPQANAGRIFVANDEWPLTDTAFAWPGTQSSQFALNIAEFFAPSGGDFLVWSTNFGLNQPMFANTLTGAGYGLEFGAPSLPLLSYEAIFLGGQGFTGVTQDLIDYVDAGGDVYLMGGTGSFFDPGFVLTPPQVEAAYWNPFLNNYGLAFHTQYNGIVGPVANVAAATHPIFDGVNSLYQVDGQTIFDLEPANPDNALLVTWTLPGDGLYALYDDLPVIPEPGTWVACLMGLAFVARRRKR